MSETNLPKNWQSLSDEEKLEFLAKAKSAQKGTELKVTVDTEGFKEVIKRNKELEQALEEKTTEAEDFESKLRLVAEEKLSQKRKKLGLDELNPSTGEPWSPQELRAVEASRPPKGDDKISAGSIPLTSAQTGRGSSGKEFESHKEMVDFLSEKERSSDPEERRQAKALKDEMWKKFAEGVKDPDYKGFKLEIEKPITDYQELQKKKAKEESE